MALDTTSIVVAAVGALISVLIGVIGFLARGRFADLIGRTADSSAKLDEVVKLNQAQTVDLARLGERIQNVDKRITDVEERQHRLAGQINLAFLQIGIRTKKAEPDTANGGGEG